jgi:hypothetical protein
MSHETECPAPGGSGSGADETAQRGKAERSFFNQQADKSQLTGWRVSAYLEVEAIRND